VNHLLSSWIAIPQELDGFIVTPRIIEWALRRSGIEIPEDLEQMTPEEIYQLFSKNLPRLVKEECPNCGSGKIVCRRVDTEQKGAWFECKDCGHTWEADIEFGSGTGGIPIPIKGIDVEIDITIAEAEEGEILQRGDPEIYDKPTKEDVEEAVKKAVTSAYTQQKLAGKIPIGLKRMVDDLIEAKVSWHCLLRQAIRTGLGKTVVSSYLRPSRKHPSLPGIRRFTLPKVHVGIDTSGSISQEELRQFLSELFNISKQCEVIASSWDADVYESVRISKAGDVMNKFASSLRGWGGTEIYPWLERVNKTMKMRDLVVVMSDGQIWDIDYQRTQELLRKVASKASVAIFVTTHTEPKLEGWQIIKITT
jgi:transcription elongation factor Elf1